MPSAGFTGTMKDSGIVLSTQGNYARVQVSCARACRECSASALCSGKSAHDGAITVLNRLQALPGDTVEIDIPESRYHRSLIGMFGGGLGAALAGAAAGYGLSGTLSLDADLSAALGLAIGLGAAAPVLIKTLKKNAARLYPAIIDITHQGDRHG